MSTRYSRILAISIISLTGLMITGVALSRLLRPRLPHIELDRSRYPVVGVDLSAHNGIPDFDSLSAYGIDFVYLKARASATRPLSATMPPQNAQA